MDTDKKVLWVENIELVELRTGESASLTHGEIYQNHIGATKFQRKINYDNVSVDYANHAVLNTEFEPMAINFKAYVEVNSDLNAFKKHLRYIGNNFELRFTYNGNKYSVYVDLVEEVVGQAAATIFENFELKFETRTHFLQIEDFGFDFEGSSVEHIGDPLPSKLKYRLDNSVKNTLDEAHVDFKVDGDYPAFLEIQMEGPKLPTDTYINPSFGLNARYDQTKESYKSKNINMNVGDILEVNSFPLTRRITKNGVDVGGDRVFKGHKTFLMVDTYQEEQTIFFYQCLRGNIRVIKQYVLPR